MEGRFLERKYSAPGVYLALVIAAFAVYGNSLNNSFHFDDAHSILQNPHIRSLDGVGGFFVDSATFSGEKSMGMYRPLTQTTFALNYTAGSYAPFGYHFVNVFLHALCACAVFSLVRRLCRSPECGALAAMLFVVHPIHSQAVNYISARAEVLAGFGSLVALALVIRGGTIRGAAVSYGMALLAKSTASATLPILVLWEWSRPARLRQWRRYWPFAFLSTVFVITISLDGFLPRSLAQDVRPMQIQIGIQLKALPYYLKLIAMPVSLSVEHAFYEVEGIADGAAAAGFLLGLSLLIGVWRMRHRAPWLGFGIGWFLASLSLTFLIPLNVLVSEHRLYVASVGMLIALAAILVERGGEATALQAKTGERLKWPDTRLLVTLLACTMLLGVITVQRNRLWQSEFTLWQDAVAKAPMMFRAQSNLALAMHEAGEYEAARRGFERSLELNPLYSKTWSNLGLSYVQLGRTDEARLAFERALELRPDLSGTLNNLGRLHVDGGRLEIGKGYLLKAVAANPLNPEARVNLGKLYQSLGDVAAARAEYEKAIDIDDGFAPAYNNLGLMQWENGDLDRAHRMLSHAVALAPLDAATHINLILLESAQSGEPRDAAYRQALARYPDNAELWKALAEYSMRRQQWDEAVTAYEELLRREPGVPGGLAYLGDACRRAGRAAEAIEPYRQAVAAEPRNIEIYNSLASTYAELGQIDSAIAMCRQILLDPENKRALRNIQELGGGVQK